MPAHSGTGAPARRAPPPPDGILYLKHFTRRLVGSRLTTLEQSEHDAASSEASFPDRRSPHDVLGHRPSVGEHSVSCVASRRASVLPRKGHISPHDKGKIRGRPPRWQVRSERASVGVRAMTVPTPNPRDAQPRRDGRREVELRRDDFPESPTARIGAHSGRRDAHGRRSAESRASA